MRWPWANRARVRESRDKIREHDAALDGLKAQRPKVAELAAFARSQLDQNHLTELVSQIPRRRHP